MRIAFLVTIQVEGSYEVYSIYAPNFGEAEASILFDHPSCRIISITRSWP